MGNNRDSLGDRMKRYENVPKVSLVRRMPVIIRLDGKAFHTFTRGFVKPFDTLLMQTMNDTMKYLCENIQGCVMGYTQSDEISLVLVDYQTLTSDAWFDNNVEKMCSIAASMATLLLILHGVRMLTLGHLKGFLIGMMVLQMIRSLLSKVY